jgi:oxepin-CoA hydrolase/3-oxo-5,6-dehydrosuberyl-CoA semialdehyde dehydrogenase
VTHVLQSYSEGRWQSGGGDAKPLLDASTGEEVARIPSAGPDVAAMLTYARSTGGPALRALSFHERAAVLKALAKHLSVHLDEFAAVSLRTGATRRDTTVDVDGGFGTVAVYASKAARELPTDTLLLDGDVESLGKGGTFAGRHVFTSKLGAAVQINAFNFPVWGMLEKFAPAFLAGMPSVVKPASETAYLTELVVRRINESELLPEGALSLLCAGPAGLLDNLTPQDTLSFTGSASTARSLRIHPVIVDRSVPLNVEADSLNCSILGPDVTVEDPEFDLFVKQVVSEMTVKAGQKCTAIRRALVPVGIADAVSEAIAARLDQVVVGHPAEESVRMGPVVSLRQREEVRNSVERLMLAATVIQGNPSQVDVVGADPGRGAFLAPMLLRCDDITAPEPHSIEAFGPVCTVLPYRNLDGAVEAAGRGEGSLVGSLVTADGDIARRLITGLAPWHGRLLVLNEADAAESTGHGVAMPQMLHGGPGRAGGGEELGGLRAITHHMQRTAVQGHPELLRSLAPFGEEEA